MQACHLRLNSRCEAQGVCSSRRICTPAALPRRSVAARSSNDPDRQASTSQPQETGAGLKAVWFAAELLGKAINVGKASTADPATPRKKMTREEIVAAVKEDYEENYFVSGKADMTAYAEDCEFADPFVSFRGTGRFKQNVGNFAGLLKDVKLDVYSFEESANEIKTKWRFSCMLGLPWRPLLAAAGSTTHIIDPEAGCIVRHVEAWDVEPKKVVAQLFKPAAKVPTTAAETFFLAVSDGDAQGVWFSISPLAFKLSLPVVGISLACKLLTGEGLPGTALGAIEGVAYLLLISAAITEVIKFAQGMQGGETGTGGRF